MDEMFSSILDLLNFVCIFCLIFFLASTTFTSKISPTLLPKQICSTLPILSFYSFTRSINKSHYKV